MSRLFQKSKNDSIDYMIEYINSYSDEADDEKLFKYLYILSKKYIIDNKYSFKDNEHLDSMSIKCASILFDRINDGSFIRFDLDFKDVISIVTSFDFKLDEVIIGDDTSNLSNSFSNYIYDRLDKTKFNSFYPVDIADQIYYFVKKNIPKKRNSSEWYNIYKSILLTTLKTISVYSDLIFDPWTVINPKVVLYNCPEVYSQLVKVIVIELLYGLRDSFNSIVYFKRENIFTVRFKEFLQAHDQL